MCDRGADGLTKQNRGARARHRGVIVEECKEAFGLGRSGNDLLSRVLRHSTIGAEEFNGRVRDGIGFGLLAQITGPAKDKRQAKFQLVVGVFLDAHGHGP